MSDVVQKVITLLEGENSSLHSSIAAGQSIKSIKFHSGRQSGDSEPLALTDIEYYWSHPSGDSGTHRETFYLTMGNLRDLTARAPVKFRQDFHAVSARFGDDPVYKGYEAELRRKEEEIRQQEEDARIARETAEILAKPMRSYPKLTLTPVK